MVQKRLNDSMPFLSLSSQAKFSVPGDNRG